MLKFTDYIYIGLYVLVILVLTEIIEYMFIIRRGGNVITIEDTISSNKSNEIRTNTRFKKKKDGKDNTIIEGFLDCPTPSSIDSLTGSIGSASTAISNCERATWLFCDTNFDKLIILLKMIHPLSTYESKGGDNSLKLDGNLFLGDYIDDSTMHRETGSRRMEADYITLYGDGGVPIEY